MDRVTRATVHVDNQFFRALTVLRAVTLVFTVGINAVRWRDFEHPVTAWVLIGVMVAWSAAVTWLYDRPERRRTWVFLVDMAVTVALLRTTVYVETTAMLEAHDSTLTSYWVATVVLCCATRWGAVGGVIASIVMQTADVTLRPHITSSTVGNVFLMVAAALLVGYCASMMRSSAIMRTQAERAAAVAGERERLARAVHDGVLQVLAMVQRRGAEIGGESAELGRMAGEQEAALRALIQSAVSVESVEAGQQELADLAAALNALSSPHVTVSTPGRPVLLRRETVEELVAAVLACLDNVTVHVGAGEPAWVLLEEQDDGVLVSVRDDGPGIVAGRLDAARTDGRMGVAKSVRGRLRDLGGHADLVTAPGQGTEWELRVPRTPTPAR
ncbi:MAG: MacS family sensor histidine kinase [Nocardioidaceae bacterium]